MVSHEVPRPGLAGRVTLSRLCQAEGLKLAKVVIKVLVALVEAKV